MRSSFQSKGVKIIPNYRYYKRWDKMLAYLRRLLCQSFRVIRPDLGYPEGLNYLPLICIFKNCAMVLKNLNLDETNQFGFFFNSHSLSYVISKKKIIFILAIKIECSYVLERGGGSLYVQLCERNVNKMK